MSDMDHRTTEAPDQSSVTQAAKIAALRARYPKSYGAWAGNPEGNKPDYARCCETIWTRERWSRHMQCSRPRGHGPDGAYCKQHDPKIVDARRTASDERGKAKWNKKLKEAYGPTFFKALVEIAEGHNDPRTLARDTLKASGLWGDRSKADTTEVVR